jgi:thymidylate kinase
MDIKNKLIVCEGPDNCGKSSTMAVLATLIDLKKIHVTETKQPGGGGT